MSIVYYFLFGVVFGLAATVPPGPINTEIARRTLKHGLAFGIAFGLGSIFVENGLAVIACTSGYGFSLEDHPRYRPVLLFVGFMVLSIMGTASFMSGYRAWQDPAVLKGRSTRGFEPIVPPPADAPAVEPTVAAIDTELREEADDALAAGAAGGSVRRSSSLPKAFGAGVGMAIISPYTIAFWLIGLPSAAHDALEHPRLVIALLLGILGGSAAWIAGFSALLSMIRRYSSSSTWWIVWTDLIGGVMLLSFAALALLELLRTLLAVRHSMPTIEV